MSHRQALLLCALASFGTGQAQAGQAAVDADLLEFLGSIGEDDDWQDFLEHTPVKTTDAKSPAAKPAAGAQKTPAKAPEASGAAATPKEKTK